VCLILGSKHLNTGVGRRLFVLSGFMVCNYNVRCFCVRARTPNTVPNWVRFYSSLRWKIHIYKYFYFLALRRRIRDNNVSPHDISVIYFPVNDCRRPIVFCPYVQRPNNDQLSQFFHFASWTTFVHAMFVFSYVVYANFERNKSEAEIRANKNAISKCP